jgi:Family of unknown function (DUF6165)
MAVPHESTPVIAIEISPGELVDKVSILEIKSERIVDPEKLANVRRELGLYRKIVATQLPVADAMANLIRELKTVNEILWVTEDEIRDCEARQDFGDAFIQLARTVYKTNDRRASIKREINILCGSSIIEEKSYKPY